MAKEATKEAKKSTGREKIPVNDTTDEGLVSKYTTAHTTNNRKTNNPIQKKKKMGRRSK